MSIYNLSFLTPSNVFDRELILDKKYSQYLTLPDESILSFASDSGFREIQQDSIAVCQKDNVTLLLVADGMGGLSFGETVSYITAETIQNWFKKTSTHELNIMSEDTLEKEMYTLIYIILSTIPYNSGTTLNMSLITENKTLIVNIGDSRTYTIKSGKISLITKDDTQAFEKFKPKTSEERDKIRFYNNNHLITNAISRKKFPRVRVMTINNEDYDIICHMTDGISDILSESTIAELCQSPNPALSLVGSSIYSPRIKGEYHLKDKQYNEYIEPGKDNATAIVYTKKYTKNN